MRHAASGAPEFVARHLEIPVINAGDGTHEHPSQGLLDALTIRDRKGTIEDLNVTILGDIKHSRVARSNIHLLGKFGCELRCAGRRCGCRSELEELAPNGNGDAARVSNRRRRWKMRTWCWCCACRPSGMHEPAISLNEYILLYQLNAERLRLAKPDAIVLHPGR